MANSDHSPRRGRKKPKELPPGKPWRVAKDSYGWFHPEFGGLKLIIVNAKALEADNPNEVPSLVFQQY
jgi:hypothetical protein